MSKENVVPIHKWNIFQYWEKKKRGPATCHDIDGAGEHYAK